MKCSLTSWHRLNALCNMILQCNYCLSWALVFAHPFTQEMADKCLLSNISLDTVKQCMQHGEFLHSDVSLGGGVYRE